jgi:SAM-dependent methyltransferase
MSADHLARYYFAGTFARDKRILDVGTGHGYGPVILRNAGGFRIEACDIDQHAIEGASRAYGQLGIRYFVDDAEELSLVTKPVDLLCSFENIEHLQHPERFVEAAARVIAKDGLMICSTPDRLATPPFVDNKPANPFHQHEWYRDEFRSLLSRAFGQVDIWIQVRSHALASRQEGLEALEKHLNYLWRNPLMRVIRLAQTLTTGRRPRWWSVWGLATPSMSDFPVLEAEEAGLVGTPSCHVAVCRHPRN